MKRRFGIHRMERFVEIFLALFASLVVFSPSLAQPMGMLTPVAGGGADGDGPALTASLVEPAGLAVDANRGLLIAESDNNRVRRIDSFGTLSTFAGIGPCCLGSGGFGGDDGPASLARVNAPWAVAVDRQNRVYIADTRNHRIRRVDPDGTIRTVAGDGEPGFSGDGGPATAAHLSAPRGIAVGRDGSLYIADTDNRRIRKVMADGTISSVAGDGTVGTDGDGGPAALARFISPWGMTVDGAGALLVADSGGASVRRITPDGTITRAAGDGTEGYAGDGGSALNARLMSPAAVAVDGAGAVFIADSGNGRIRKVDLSGIITTVAGGGNAPPETAAGKTATDAALDSPWGVAIDAKGALFVADSNHGRIWRIDGAAATGLIAGEPIPFAEMKVEPDRLEFGDREMGTAVTSVVKVRNVGTGPLTLRDVTVLGVDGSDFAVDGSACGSSSIQAGMDCVVTVTFTPTALGPRQAELILTESTGEESARLPLAGTGIVTSDPGANAPVLSAASVAGAPGETVLIVVSADDRLKGLAALQFKARVPGLAGTIDDAGIAFGPLLGGDGWLSSVNASQPGEVFLGAIGSKAHDGPGTVATIAVRIDPATMDGEYPILISDVKASDSLLAPIPFRVVNGILTVRGAPAVRKGDLNGDGRVNVQDATLSLRIAVGLAQPTEEQRVSGDANGDGRLNVQDATLILRIAVGLPVFTA